MLYFNAIFAFGIVSFFTLVASQMSSNFDCNKNEVQSLDVMDCIKAARKFKVNNDVITFKPSGNAQCYETCLLTIKLATPVSVTGTRETEGIGKTLCEATIRAATSPQECGRVGLTATVKNIDGKQVAMELKGIKGHCVN